MKNILRKVLFFFNLDAELENQDVVYEEITKGSNFKGTNLWILMFAIIVASVGLNMNSTAVIIGAMLISPLMGPINGIGYSLATFDLVLLRKAVKNFTFAILASLLASSTYFTLSPITTAHSELLARTTPTIYDVIIAMFGGLAGIVAISSKNKGNVIPGVAIATALMPPLCTAGYGIATFQFNFFFGAIYLFTINTIFIAFASVLVSQLLKFPIRSIIEPSKKKRITRITNSTILIVFIPSIFFGYNLVKQEEFLQNAQQFVKNISYFDGNFLLKHKIDASNRQIILVYAGAKLTDNQKTEIKKISSDFNLTDTEITFEKGLTFDKINESNQELFRLKEKISLINNDLNKKDFIIDSLKNINKLGDVILNEIKTIFPQITGCSYSETDYYSGEDTLSTSYPISIVTLKQSGKLSKTDKEKIDSWLNERLRNKQVKVFYESD